MSCHYSTFSAPTLISTRHHPSFVLAMVTQNFVGDKPVDIFPPEAIQKITDDELTKRELKRLSKGADKEPGANKRAGAATRDPARTSVNSKRPKPTDSYAIEFDTKRRGGQGDHLPTKGMLAWFESPSYSADLLQNLSSKSCDRAGLEAGIWQE